MRPSPPAHKLMVTAVADAGGVGDDEESSAKILS